MATCRLKQTHCQAESRLSTASVDDADHADTRDLKQMCTLMTWLVHCFHGMLADRTSQMPCHCVSEAACKTSWQWPQPIADTEGLSFVGVSIKPKQQNAQIMTHLDGLVQASLANGKNSRWAV